jgi:hypothetical protein
MAPLCVMWCLWRERKVQSFKDRELGTHRVEEKGAPNTFLLESIVAFTASFNACGISRFLWALLYTSCVHGLCPSRFL